MRRRVEFSPLVVAEIVDRSKDGRGVICCEGCSLALGFKAYEIDHKVAEGLRPAGPREKLTADDGQLLGVDCCHKGKTKVDKGLIAKAKRREARFRGLPKPPSRRGFFRPPDMVFNWNRGRYERLRLEE